MNEGVSEKGRQRDSRTTENESSNSIGYLPSLLVVAAAASTAITIAVQSNSGGIE